jgi:hypothetical protein
MQPTGSHRFKSIIVQRFHDYFYPRLTSREIDPARFFEDFDVKEQAKYQFFSGMRSGAKGVTADQALIAFEKYGVRPDYLFGIVEEPVSMVAEPAKPYAKSISTDISKIRKLLDELEKKVKT